MTSRRFATIATAVALCFVGLSACGSKGSDTSTQAKTTTSSKPAVTTTTQAALTTTTQATPTTTDPSESSEGRDTETSVLDTLPDGSHYGFIAGTEDATVEGQKVQAIIWDEVEFLTGQAAIDAADEDGAVLDSDYYVRNLNQQVKRIAVVPEAQVWTLAGDTGPDLAPSSVDEVSQQEWLFKIEVGNVRGITTISGIEAVYLP